MKKLFLILALFLMIMVPQVYALGFENVTVLNNSDSYLGGKPTIEGNGTRKVTITFDSALLKIVKSNPSQGRTIDAAWLGVKIVAPKDVPIATLKKATYVNNGSTVEKSFWNNQDSNKSESQSDEHYINVYGAITEEFLTNAAKKGAMIEYSWTFDWDNDGDDDQTVIIKVEPKNAVLIAINSNDILWNQDMYNDLKPDNNPDTGDTILVYVGIMALSIISEIYAIKKIKMGS